MPAATLLPKIETVTSPATETTLRVKEQNNSAIEPRIFEQTKLADTKIFTVPLQEAEITARPTYQEKSPQAAEIMPVILSEAKPSGLSPIMEQGYGGFMRENDEYRIPRLEAEINSVDVETENILPEGNEVMEEWPSDEFWQPSENLSLRDVQEINASEVLPKATAETNYPNFSRYEVEGPQIVHYELSAPVEEIEQTILELAERIEESEAEEAKATYQLLDEIVLKAKEARTTAASDAENQEGASEAEEIEDELKELFIQLFEQVEIEYSNKLIKSCVKLALKGDMLELIAKTEQEDEEIDALHDRGTHEAIKQLLATINSIKKAVLHAYHIGKSALHLYSQQLVAGSI